MKMDEHHAPSALGDTDRSLLRRALREDPYLGRTIADMVDHPPHYTSHPSEVECIEITEHMNFCVGNAMKYLWRCDLKGDAVENLEKAKWYIEREISRRVATATAPQKAPIR